MVLEKLWTSLPASPFVLIALCLVYGLISFRVMQRKYSNIPGPVPWPIIGNFLDIKPYLSGPLTVQDCFAKWSQKYGSIFKLWVGNKPWLIVSEPDYVKEILTGNRFPKDPTYYSPINYLYGQRFAGGGSAVQTNSEKYAHQKKITNMAYHRRYLPKFGKSTLSVVARFVDALQYKEGFFPICDELDMLSCCYLSKIAFDMDIPFVYSDDHGEEQQLYRLVNVCFQGIKDKLFNPIGCTLHLKKVEKVRKAARKLREVGEKFIRSTYDKIRAGDQLPDAMFSYVLQEIHEAGGSFSLEEIIDEFVVQFVAGTETTSNFLKFILMEVTRNPHVYDRLQVEIDGVMELATPDTLYEDMNNNMPYLEQVMQEVLRMYPVAVATTRTNYLDTYLGKTLIPAGSTIMVCFHVLHRHPDFFERPNEFDPDRWGPGKPAPIPYTFLPFSAGYRGCTGRHLAKLEAKMTVCNLLYHYKLEAHPDQNYEVATTLTAKPKNPVLMKTTSRHRHRTLYDDLLESAT